MPNTFEQSTGFPTIYEALKTVSSVGQAQSFFRTYVTHLLQTEKWGDGTIENMDEVARRLIATVLREDQRVHWEGILSQDGK